MIDFMDEIPRPVRLVPFVGLYVAFMFWFYNAVPQFFMNRLEDGPSQYTNPVVWCMDTDSQDWRVAKITDTSSSDMWSIFLHKKAENIVQGGVVIPECVVRDEFGNGTFWLVVAGLALIAGATALGGVFFPYETWAVLSSPFVWVPLLIVAAVGLLIAAFFVVMFIAAFYALAFMLGILGIIGLTSK